MHRKNVQHQEQKTRLGSGRDRPLGDPPSLVRNDRCLDGSGWEAPGLGWCLLLAAAAASASSVLLQSGRTGNPLIRIPTTNCVAG